MARFLVCMLVIGLKVASWDKCLMRNSRVLQCRPGAITDQVEHRHVQYTLLYCQPTKPRLTSMLSFSQQMVPKHLQFSGDFIHYCSEYRRCRISGATRVCCELLSH